MFEDGSKRIAFVTHKLTGAGGGVSESIRCLGRELATVDDIQLEVFGLKDHRRQLDLAAWKPVAPTILLPTFPSFLGHVPSLSRQLSDADVVHSHGLWKLTSRSVTQWHARTGRPFVVSPHGMLHPLALQHSPLRKRIAGFLWENAHLGKAACLHALCEPEAIAIRNFGCRNPVCVIPNGVDIPPLDSIEKPDYSGKKTLLYLGRIHRDKGLRLVLRAWPSFAKSAPDWQLHIVGWDDGGHQRELEKLVVEHDLSSSVRFLGPKFGAAKVRAYQQAHAIILASSFEALPMVVLEAWSYARPVLMTAACNLQIGFETGAAIEIATTPDGVLKGLRQISEMRSEDCRQMGEAGRELVETRFAWHKIANDLADVYRWISGTSMKPPTVI